jgi:hypothetical protein
VQYPGTLPLCTVQHYGMTPAGSDPGTAIGSARSKIVMDFALEQMKVIVRDAAAVNGCARTSKSNPSTSKRKGFQRFLHTIAGE